MVPLSPMTKQSSASVSRFCWTHSAHCRNVGFVCRVYHDAMQLRDVLSSEWSDRCQLQVVDAHKPRMSVSYTTESDCPVFSLKKKNLTQGKNILEAQLHKNTTTETKIKCCGAPGHSGKPPSMYWDIVLSLFTRAFAVFTGIIVYYCCDILCYSLPTVPTAGTSVSVGGKYG